MRPIMLREEPRGSMGMPEIFEGGVNLIRRAVVIGNGFAGAENQSIGLIRALGVFDSLTIYHAIRPRGGYNAWIRWLPLSLHKIIDDFIKQLLGTMMPHGGKIAPFPAQVSGSIGLSSLLEADARHIASIARDNFEKEGLLLVVASGWDTISIAASIKRLAPQNVFLIQIQHPRSRLDRFDLVVTPRHDYHALTPQGQKEIPRLFRRWITPREPPGQNVVLTLGALHMANSSALAIAASEWHDELAPLPNPLIAVNVGGPTRHCRYGADLAMQLAGSLQNVLPSCGSVRISFSRRTPRKVSDIIIRELGDHPKVYIWDGKGSNPHMGHLAWANAFVITADSISMLSEACSTGKPVYVIGAERCSWKFSVFHRMLRERGLVRPFTGLEDVSKFWSYSPLNDAADVALRVREALAERGWSIRRR